MSPAPRPADIRAWALEQGYQLGNRGALPREVKERYDMANGTAVAVLDPPETYPDDDDFGPGPEADPPAGPGWAPEAPPSRAEPGPAPAETRPQRPASARRRGTAVATKGTRPGGVRGLLGRGKGAPKAAAGKAHKPRVSTSGMLSSVWRNAAKLARPLPPLYRTLAIQAPVAGDLLDDAVRGTVVDTFLQPFARLGGNARAVNALLGPPVLVTMLSLYTAQCAAKGIEPNALFMSTGAEALRSSLMVWAEVSGPKFEAAIAKERDFEEKHGATVDQLMAFLFAPPVATTAEQAAEDAQIRRAQGYTEAA